VNTKNAKVEGVSGATPTEFGSVWSKVELAPWFLPFRVPNDWLLGGVGKAL